MFEDSSAHRTLFQYYTSVLTAISTLAASRDYGDPEELASKMNTLLRSVKEDMLQNGKNIDWVSDSQYAVVAYIDETINKSQWQGKSAWQRNPLIARLELQPNPGVAFFEKLRDWMKSPHPPAELLEVFYVCLGLGFEGQYFSQQEKLAEIKQDILNSLALDVHRASHISPNAARKADEQVRPESDDFPWAWICSIALTFLLVVFTVLKWMSLENEDDLRKEIRKTTQAESLWDNN